MAVLLDYRQHSALADLALALDVAFIPGEAGQPTRVLLEGEDVGVTLRTEHTGHLASQVAVVPAVRDALLDLQRRQATPPGLVMEGRDVGTVVFPRAAVKFFITADAGERAKRRWLEMRRFGREADPELIQPIEVLRETSTQYPNTPAKAPPHTRLQQPGQS